MSKKDNPFDWGAFLDDQSEEIDYENAPAANHQEFELTNCQFNATNEIIAWSYNPDKLFITLAGPAGTGKSWLSRFILKQLPQRNVCVTAVTHQALKRIKKASGQEGITGQALMGIAPNESIEDYDPVNVEFDSVNPPRMEEFDLILWDECSMIQEGLLDAVIELAILTKTKILFVGDKIQLPPINERCSQVFNATKIDGGVVYLSTPCRQSVGSRAYTLLLADRNDIEMSNQAHHVLVDHLKDQDIYTETLYDAICKNPHETYTTLRNFLGDVQINDKGQGYIVHRNKESFQTSMEKTFHKYFNQQNYDGVRALAFTNAAVGVHNKAIRSHIFPNADEPIIEGDILMCYRPITKWDSLKKRNYTILHNSEEVVITETEKVITRLQIPVHSSVGQSLDGGQNHLLAFVDPGYYGTYMQQLEQVKSYCQRAGRWKSWYDFYDEHILLESLSSIFNDPKLPKKGFDYAYAMTVHKSQGSTFNEVYVNLPDILTTYYNTVHFAKRDGTYNGETELHAKLFAKQLRYVAASRASEIAHFLVP